MPFLFKLAKRIARIRSRSWILAAAAALACEPGDSSLSGPSDPSLATIDGQPAPLTDLAVSAATDTVLLRESFEDASFGARGWYDTASVATTPVQHIPGSTRALQVFYKAGVKTPMSARHLFPASESVHLSYWVKYSGNWIGSGGAYFDEFFLMTNEDDPRAGASRTHLTAYIEHSYQNGGIPVLQLQDGLNIDQSRIGQNLTTVTENRAAAGCNGDTDGYPTRCYTYNNEKTFQAGQPSFLPTPGPGYKADWHFVEAYVKLNSIQNGKAVADGVVRYWFDGRLVIDHINVLLRTGAHPNMQFNQLVIAPYIANGSPIDQVMWLDNLTVATARPASAPSAYVASVTVSPSPASVAVGGTSQLTATLRDSSGNVVTGRTISWSSGNAVVATVSGSGLATAVHAGTATITATSEGKSAGATITVTAVPPAQVASVTVSPASASLLVGTTQQLSAVTKDAVGNPLTGRVVTWSSSNASVATVNGSGLVTGLAAGLATITATSEGKSSISTISVSAPGPSRPGFYVTPTGSASGDGSVSRPWDLATALSGGGGRVQPGDTIWLRGGTYTGVFTGKLNGTAAKPIIVRQYPGERATILGNGGQFTNTLTIVGSYTWYWGFEAIGSPVNLGYVVHLGGTNNKLINVVAHDCLGQGIAMFQIGSELYGSIVYNLGPAPAMPPNIPQAGDSYALYISNATGIKTVSDNIMFNTTAFGIQAYNGHGPIVNITFSGNAIFNSGLTKPAAPSILFLNSGGSGVAFTNNYTYQTNPQTPAAEFNRSIGSSDGLVVTGNFLHGTTEFGPATNATITGNTFYSTGPSLTGDILSTAPQSGGTWRNNVLYRNPSATAWRHAGINYNLAGWKAASGLGATDTNLGTAPSGTQVIVRPNKYEAGRANIIIYNWANAATANVDLSAVLRVGQAYTIVNAQNFYGAPVASGIYAGGTVSLSMAAVQSPAPRYASFKRPVTGPTFQVFVVRPQGS